jgi:hypothetical protein
MKPLAIALATCAMLAGCTKNPPLAARTQVPQTNLQVVLYGPDAKRAYRYEILDAGIPVISRPLGTARIGSYPRTEIVPVGKRGVKIEWTGGRESGYAILDPNARMVVEDSNEQNRRYERFRSLRE